MQESINKLKSYLGFSIKSNSIVFGYDNITKSRKKFDVVIFCKTATNKHIDSILNVGNKCVKLTGHTLGEIIGRENVKVVAIKNYNLAKAILTIDNLFETLN